MALTSPTFETIRPPAIRRESPRVDVALARGVAAALPLVLPFWLVVALLLARAA